MATVSRRGTTMSYRFDQFRREHLRDALAFRSGKDPGWQAPDFDLPTTDGSRMRKADFVGTRPVLLAFASLTDPVTASAAPVLKALHREFGSEVAFVTVYVREAHPGDRIPQPRKAEWKMHHAKRLQARDAIPWTVAVDDLDGTLHRSLGGHGASAHLLDPNGNVAFQALFSSDGAALREALFAVARGVAGGHPSSSERKLVPALRALGRYDDVVRAAGPRALCDLRSEAPLLYGAAELAWVWRALTPLGRVALAAAGAVGAAAVVGGLTLATRRRLA
jgi:hypothetical protein